MHFNNKNNLYFSLNLDFFLSKSTNCFFLAFLFCLLFSYLTTETHTYKEYTLNETAHVVVPLIMVHYTYEQESGET